MDLINYFKKNAEILKKINPLLLKKILAFRQTSDSKVSHENSEQNSKLTFELLETKISGASACFGGLTFKINGLTVHSAYDPVAEGKKWALSVIEKYTKKNEKPENIIIFGFGFGYHINELSKLLEDRFGKFNLRSESYDECREHNERSENEDNNKKNKKQSQIKISVFEPSVESLNFILSNCDVSELLYKISIFISEKDIVIGETDRRLFELISYKNIFKNEYARIYKKININQFFSPSSFRVLIAQPMYGGSSTVGNYIYKAFLNSGYQADIMDFSRFYDGYKYLSEFTQNEDHINSLRQMLSNLMSEALLSAVMNNPPDMVLFMAQSPATERVILKLKNMGIITAYWFVEDFRTLTYWSSIAKHVDYFFTIQKDEFFKELENMGLHNFYYLPLACLPSFHNRIAKNNNEHNETGICNDIKNKDNHYYNHNNYNDCNNNDEQYKGNKYTVNNDNNNDNDSRNFFSASPNTHKNCKTLNEYEYEYKDDKKKYACDVSFAGAGYFNRKNVFAKLADFNFKIWGNDWIADMPLSLLIQDGGKRFTEEEAVKIYNYSKININLHSSMWHWDINPDGDFLNPRVYEILGCGGFQLVDRRRYMEGVFEDGKDLVIFENVDDLRKKIRYYLDNEHERLAIAEHGYNTVRKHHTYEQRVSEMMNIILLNSYDTIKNKLISRRENILKLLNETEKEPELYRLLEAFKDKGSVSIAELVEYIRRGKGKLSKTEAMILMLWSAKANAARLEKEHED